MGEAPPKSIDGKSYYDLIPRSELAHLRKGTQMRAEIIRIMQMAYSAISSQ